MGGSPGPEHMLQVCRKSEEEWQCGETNSAYLVNVNNAAERDSLKNWHINNGAAGAHQDTRFGGLKYFGSGKVWWNFLAYRSLTNPLLFAAKLFFAKLCSVATQHPATCKTIVWDLRVDSSLVSEGWKWVPELVAHFTEWLKELRTEIALQKSYFHLYIIDISYLLTTKMEFILTGIKRFIMKCSNYSYCLCYISCVFVIKCISSKLSGIDGWLSILHFMYVILYSVAGWTNIELQDPSAGVITTITPWALLIGFCTLALGNRIDRWWWKWNDAPCSWVKANMCEHLL